MKTPGEAINWKPASCTKGQLPAPWGTVAFLAALMNCTAVDHSKRPTT